MICVVCNNSFERTGTRGPIPKYCSPNCRARANRDEHRRAYERAYRANSRAAGKRKAYEFEYNRRPEVLERNRKRMKDKWYNDPEYRQKQLARWSNPFANVQIAAPYTGHRWLDMARNAVSKTWVNPLAPWSDDYYDDMGEAVLALLEGRNVDEAVKEYRSKEYRSRKMFIRMGDWGDDEDEQRKFFEKVMPQDESAEDQYFAGVVVADRFNQVSKKRRRMKHKTQQPSYRRRKDGRSWRKHA